MTTKISEKIISQEVVSESTQQPPTQMHEKIARPSQLSGTTYKLKPPITEHAFYVTINNITLNPDTPHERTFPFEIFINSKNMEHFQWTVALTRIMSSVFRKGGDVAFMVEELKSVFDPKGGYFKKGGRYIPSLVAAIGDVLNEHLISLGLAEEPVLDEHQKKLIKEYSDQVNGSFPSDAALCDKCQTKAVVVRDNCEVCLNCGESKCG
jgi:hypothetical protein